MIEETPRPIQDIIPEAPIWLCEVIARLHAKNPNQRFATALDVANALAQPESTPATAKIKPSARRLPWIATAAAVLLACVLGSGWWLAEHIARSNSPESPIESKGTSSDKPVAPPVTRTARSSELEVAPLASYSTPAIAS